MQSNAPCVSIGMPVYNGEEYLGEAIESLLTQTFSDFELIISDNASTDRTADICRAYAARDPRVRYVRNGTNLGAARNYNQVVELARGKYFKWASHDDVCAPQLLERCVAVLEREPAVVLCYARTQFIDEEGQVIEKHEDRFDLRSSSPHERFAGVFEAPGWCNPIFGVVRTDVLRQTALIGGYYSSDRVLLAELALRGRFYEVPEYLFSRRIHDDMSMRSNPSRVQLAAWFDPNRRKSLALLFPRWRWFSEYLKAIRRAPLSRYQRVRSFLHVVRHVVLSRYWARVELSILATLLSRSLRSLLSRAESRSLLADL